MNGPEHYTEAERLLVQSYDADDVLAPTLVGQAQVHATLALVAATMNAADVVHWSDDREGSRGTGPRDLYPGDGMIWSEVL